MIAKEQIIRAIGEEAFLEGMRHKNDPCPYEENDAISIGKMLLEEGRCLHCHVRQCPSNK